MSVRDPGYLLIRGWRLMKKKKKKKIEVSSAGQYRGYPN